MSQAAPVPVFIVNGEEVCPDGAPFRVMAEAMDRAIQQSFANSRPFEDWELRDINGVLQDTSRALEPSDDQQHFYVTLKLGTGGA